MYEKTAAPSNNLNLRAIFMSRLSIFQDHNVTNPHVIRVANVMWITYTVFFCLIVMHVSLHTSTKHLLTNQSYEGDIYEEHMKAAEVEPF